MQRSTGSLLYLWTRSGGNNYFSITEGQTYTFSILVAQNSDSFDLNYAYMRRADGSQISLATTGNPTRYRVSKTKVGEVFGRSVYKYIFTFQSPFTANDTFMFFGVSDATESKIGRASCREREEIAVAAVALETRKIKNTDASRN